VLDDETEVQVARAEAEAAWAPLLERLGGPCRSALRGAQLSPERIDDLLLVGGATRMPCVRRFAREFFGKEPLGGVDPDYAVVHGAAIQAAMCAQDGAVADLVVTDIASHSLGTEVTKDFGATEVHGFFSPVIHRNTVIPVSRSAIYCTRHPNQDGIMFGIYEGESRHVKDNRKIGELNVKGIPKGPRGQEVRVTFTFDLNGLLEVEAEILATGKRVSKVFHRETGALAEDQVEEARKRLARLKRDPRENAQLRDAIARGELLLREVDAVQRRMLEEALDALERAIEDRDVEGMSAALEDLRRVCERIDGGERW
jgi:molecular chaperone HscC